jgi:Domain of unknown function (DUF4919)
MLPKCIGIAAVFLAIGYTLALPKDQAADRYPALLTRLKQGDRTVDFLEIRRAYADSREYTDTSDSEDTKAMYRALDKGDFARAIEISKKILDGNYLDIDAHQAAYLANHELHIEAEAEFHQYIAHGLISAIFQSGDCKTRETACEVLSTHEEYVILQVLDLRPGSQSLVRSGKHSYDVLDAVDPKTSQKVTLYFNIDKPMGYLDRLFSK